MSAGRFTVALVRDEIHVVDTEEVVTTSAFTVTATADAGADLHRAWAVVSLLNDADLAGYDSLEPF